MTDSTVSGSQKKLAISSQLCRRGVIGPSFNDEFGDTYSNIFAFQANGYNYEELRRVIEGLSVSCFLLMV